jgi:pyruvate kinase
MVEWEANMSDKKRTKIICTIGPATEDDDVLRNMMLSGMNVARLNFSHGTHEYHRKNIERVRRIASELGLYVAILTDTKGPEIRTRLNEGHQPIQLKANDTVRVTTKPVSSTNGCIALDYEALPREVKPQDTIFIDDGLIGLRVDRVDGEDVYCTVINGGKVGEHKGVNLPNVVVSLPAVTEQDKKDIEFSCKMGVDAIAASFVRNADAVKEIRALCAEFGAPKTQIYSKIECAVAVEKIDEILAVSDGIMVARGDLGIEIPPSDVPRVQTEIIQKCNREYRPVITATQMLDSMVHNPRPTRAEVTDVANAIKEGTDCVMLSAETAAGSYPVETVRMMAEICRKTEEYLPERHIYHDRGGMRNVSGATGYAAVEAARLVKAKALMCPTLSGRSARIMSEFRPRLPIIATAPSEATLRRTCFIWGVEGVLSHEQGSVNQITFDAVRVAQKDGLLNKGDVVVITAGDPMTSPSLEVGEITSHTPTNVFVIAEVI